MRVRCDSRSTAVNNNKAFAAWAFGLVSGSALLLGTVFLAGIASVPPLATLLTDVAMGLGIRAGYKQIGGWDWNEWKWSFSGDTAEAIAAVVRIPAESAEAVKVAA